MITLKQLQSKIVSLFQYKKSERTWHIPFLASLCVGIPLFIGCYFDKPTNGITASIGGLVFLYLPSSSLARRMVTVLACSFGFVFAFTIGVLFSFNPYLSSLVLGLFAAFVHWVSRFYQLKPPGNFFFIMIASIASCMPFNLEIIPVKVGLIAMGTMLACMIAFIYSILLTKGTLFKSEFVVVVQKNYSTIFEAVIIGFFMSLSLLTGLLLKLDNPYWIPISCAAVIQGVTLEQIWRRTFQRILGTFLGLGLTWLLLGLKLNLFWICFCIMAFQFVVETLIVRQYALTIIFMTPLTIFLADIGNSIPIDPNGLIAARFFDIVIGSFIGGFAGWLLHHRYLRDKSEKQIRKTRIAICRNRVTYF
ncbi:MAG TPA: FUSC family protein [Flavobacterium sp.]|uniref:FUSC family protein n=1 Tax=Flavobacterium sp. TaxID=239 RepID=UPI002B6627D8|nr:FUSC family protein [Flavobacterium sp.]HSD14351.1 FUSC family protein [Flavobacterium sp.]